MSQFCVAFRDVKMSWDAHIFFIYVYVYVYEFVYKHYICWVIRSSVENSPTAKYTKLIKTNLKCTFKDSSLVT